MGRIVAICFFAALATVTARSAFSQNAGDMINLFGAMMRAAIVDHARTEWSKISPDQSSCIEEALQQQGYSVGVMIQNGIAPTDPRIATIRSGCRRSTVASSPPSANDVDIQNLSSTPTFDCAKGRTLTAHIICLDRVGASADWDLTSAYWARYFSLGQDDRHAFEQAQERWLDGLNQVCRRSQNQRECVLAAYRKRAAGYRSQLDGDAVAEAHLSPEQHAQIQQSLIAQGFMDDKPDGEFGAITRSAIGKFKSDVGAPEGEFLTTQQRDQLLRGKSPTNGTIGSSGEISDKASRLSPAEAAAQCQSQNTESRLIGCTAIIDAKARGIASSVALPDAFDGRCWAYIDLENYERALADCRAAISLAPRHPYAYNNLGYAFLGLQDFTNAINAYTKSIELKPNFIFSHLGRAKAYVQSGNMELARRDFQYVLAVESTNQQALDGIAALDNPTSASDTGPKPKPLGSVAPAKETPRLRDARSFLNDAKRFIADQNSAPATLSGIANEAALLQIALDKFDEPAAVQSTQRLAALLKPIPGFEQFEQQQQATRERESARILVEARILADQNTFFINDYMKGHLGDSSTSSLNKLRDQIGTSLKKNTIEEINGANDAVKEYIAQNGLSEPYEISTRQFSQPSAPATESTKSLAGRLGLTESSDFIVKGPQDDIILLYNASATAPHVWRNVRGDIVFQNEAASLCFARAPDVAVERYIDHVLGDRGAKTFSSLATPCDLAKAETRVDVIAFQRGEFSKSREDYILSLAKLVEAGGFRKYEIITDYAAVFEQRKILSRQIETEVESNARGGFGVIALGGSPLACVIPPEGAERVDGLKELLRRNIDVIAPTAISDWQTVDTANADLAFLGLQRHRCAYVSGDSAALRSIMLALRRDNLRYGFGPVWWSDKDVDQATFDVNDLRRQKEVKDQQRKLEEKLQRDLEAQRQRDKQTSKTEIERTLREKYGVKARGLANTIHDLIRRVAEKRITDNEGMFADYSQWMEKRFSDHWVTFDVSSEISDFGVVQWQRRPLDAIVVRSVIHQKNRILGRYEDRCYMFGLVDDEEFNMWRDAVAVDCDDAQSVSKWKVGKDFQSEWNAN